jgi:hypothetical protein
MCHAHAGRDGALVREKARAAILGGIGPGAGDMGHGSGRHVDGQPAPLHVATGSNGGGGSGKQGGHGGDDGGGVGGGHGTTVATTVVVLAAATAQQWPQ